MNAVRSSITTLTFCVVFLFSAVAALAVDYDRDPFGERLKMLEKRVETLSAMPEFETSFTADPDRQMLLRMEAVMAQVKVLEAKAGIENPFSSGDPDRNPFDDRMDDPFMSLVMTEKMVDMIEESMKK
ncbi:MAG: hypothetical protein AAGB03_02200 [Pseudomonadota bacterium]